MASNTAKSSSIFRNRVSARKLYCSGTLQIPHGTLDLPSVHFDGNVHTGFYMESDGAIGFSFNKNSALCVGETISAEVPITAPGDLVLCPTGDIDISGKRIINSGGFEVDNFGAETISAGEYLDIENSAAPSLPTDALRLYSDGRLKYLDATSHNIVANDTTDTLTNKTISSADNIVDANRILGDEVTDCTDGKFLIKTGSTWGPGQIVGAGAITSVMSAGTNTISVTTGSTANTVVAGNDSRLRTQNRVVVKLSSAGAGEFTSVAAAIAFVAENNPTQSSPWLIFVSPGRFIEPELVVPSFVTVAGSGVGITIIVASGPVLFSPRPRVNIRAMSVFGGGTGTTAFELHSCQLVVLSSLSINNFGTSFHVSSENSFSNPIMFDAIIFPPFDLAVDIDGTAITSNYPSNFVITSTIIEGDGVSDNGISVRGPNGFLKLSNAEIFGVTGTGVYTDDGADLLLQSVRIHDSGLGIHVGNVGAAPMLKLTSTAVLDCTSDIDIEHPGTNGVFVGVATRSKVSVDPDALICLSYADPEVNATVIVGDFAYSPRGGVLTDVGAQFTYAAPLGTYHGGELTASGLNVTITAGSGYITIGEFPTGQILKLDWPQTVIAVPADAVSYIYVNRNGPTFASALPAVTSVLMLGRVVAGSAIEIVDPQLYGGFHPTETNKAMIRNTIGALYSSGSIVTANSSRQLAISSGLYYYLNNEVATVGQVSPATFFEYYRDAGVWTNASATVLRVQYDNGTNLAALPAGKFAKHSLYTVGRGAYERYLLVIGQTVFDTDNDAALGVLPNPPSYFGEGIVAVAAIIVSQADATFTEIIDIRPKFTGGTGTSFGAVSAHGDLTGLLNDDHPQYLLANGMRSLNGQLDMGNNAIVNASTYNGVVVTAHAARHLPNGADALATAAPLSSITTSSVSAVGTANSFARSDHTHSFDSSTIDISTCTGTLSVEHGGTGVTTFPSGFFLHGNGSSIATTKAVPSGNVVGTTDSQTLTNKTLTTPVISSISNTGTLTLPTSTDTLVGRNTTDTLTNKTLTLPVISSISNSGTISLPAGPETLVGRDTTDTLTNKTLTAPVISSIMNTDILALPVGPETLVGRDTTDTLSNKTLVSPEFDTIVNGGILTLPTGPDTLVGRSSTDTLTNKTLTLPVISSISNGGIVSLPTGPVTLVGRTTVDTLSNKTLVFPSISSISNEGTLTLPTGPETLVGRSTTDTLTNKTLTAPVIASIVNSGTITLPVGTHTLVSRTTTDTLTNKTLTTPVISSIMNTDILTLPIGPETLVGRATTDTLTNKTLTFPVISTISNSGTITLPVGAQTLVGRTTTDTLTNKTLTAPVIATIVNGGTLTLPAGPEVLVGRATNDTLTNKILTSPTISTILNIGTLTLPTSTDTLVGRSTTDTLTNKNLSAATTAVVGVDETKKILFACGGTTNTTTTLSAAQTASRVVTFPDATDTLVGRSTTDTLTNKTLTAPVIATIVNTGTLTLPTATDTLVGRATTDTLTNKTLTSPIISTISNTGTLTLPTSTDTLVGRNTSDTLTNKILTAPVISTISNTGTLTLPTTTDTLVGRATVDTLTNKTLTSPIISTISNTGTITLPTSTDTLVGRTTVDTLTNKTLTLPVISSISNIGTLTLPTTADTLVGRATVDALTNKTLADATTAFVSTDVTKRVAFAISGATTGTTTTLTFSQTANRVITFPNATDTLVGRNTTDTLANKTLSAPVISTIVNTGTLTLPTSTDTLVGRATTDTLTNKTLTAPIISTIVNTGTLTLPTSTDTLVGRATADTLTNKTLVLPVISSISNTGTLTLPSSTDVLVGRDTSDILTNKTLTTPVISTISNTGVITLPTATDTLVGRATVDTLTNKTLTLPVISSISNGGTINLPTGPETLVGRATSDIMSNKTLVSPVISTIVNTGTLTLPTSTDTLVGRATADTLTNKNLSDATTFVVDAADPTIRIGFSATGTTGTTTTIISSRTANRAYTLPDIDGDFVLTTGASTISGAKNFTTTATFDVSSVADIACAATFKNRKIVTYPVANDDHQYYGVGTNSAVQRYQVPATTSDHVFYAGTSSSTSNELMRVMGVGGIRLPTPSGTASTLNYYEVYSAASTVSGPWAARACTVSIVRCGNLVTMVIGNPATTGVFASKTTAAVITLALTLPAVFRPAFNTLTHNCVIDDATDPAQGQIRITSAGVVTIRAFTAAGTFAAANGNTVGFYNIGVSWNV